jgi:hypothetical protein
MAVLAEAPYVVCNGFASDLERLSLSLSGWMYWRSCSSAHFIRDLGIVAPQNSIAGLLAILRGLPATSSAPA